MLDKKASIVCLFKPVDPYDESNWPQQFAWLQDTLENFDRAIRPAVPLLGHHSRFFRVSGNIRAIEGFLQRVPDAVASIS